MTDKKIFIIPVGVNNKSKEYLTQIMSECKKDIDLNKDYWLPDRDFTKK